MLALNRDRLLEALEPRRGIAAVHTDGAPTAEHPERAAAFFATERADAPHRLLVVTMGQVRLTVERVAAGQFAEHPGRLAGGLRGKLLRQAICLLDVLERRRGIVVVMRDVEAALQAVLPEVRLVSHLL